MLDRFNLTSAKPVATPMEPRAKFSKDQSPASPTQVVKMRGVPYAEAIGSILWPVMISRPDCAFAVSTLAQFIQNPACVHWDAVKQVMAYMGGTKEYWLTFGGGALSKPIVKGFCDVDWAGQLHQHSILGYSFHIGQGAVTWSSKKQYIVALSSTESEYIALAHATKEGCWLRTFLSEIQNCQEESMGIDCNNQGAIALSKDNKFHQQMKHIDVRYHYIHAAVEDGKIKVKYIPTDQNLADIFTKPLPKTKFRRFTAMLGLRPWREEMKNDTQN